MIPRCNQAKHFEGWMGWGKSESSEAGTEIVKGWGLGLSGWKETMNLKCHL